MRLCSLYLQNLYEIILTKIVNQFCFNIDKSDMETVKNIFRFYVEGFKNMTWGKNLWLIIFIKVFIMFAILKLFFFSDFLGSQFENDSQKSDYVLEQLTTPNK